MKKEITREFAGATEKGIKIFYDETTGNFDIETASDEFISFYDDEDGNGKKAVEKFIAEF